MAYWTETDPTEKKGREEIEKAAVSYIRNLHEDQKEIRTQLERRWYLNLAMYNGEHYLAYDNNLQQINRPPAPSHRATGIGKPSTRFILHSAAR